MVAAVGALGRACAGEHADRIFAGAAVGVDAAGVGVAAGQVFLAEEGEQLAPGLVGGGGDLGDLLVAEGFAVVVDLDLLAADFVGGGVVGYGFEAGWPVAEELEVFRGEGLDGVVVALAEGEEGAVGGVLVGTESALIRPLGTFSRRREKGWVEGALGLSGTFSRGREKGFVAVGVELFGELAVAEFLEGRLAGRGAVGRFGFLFDGSLLGGRQE